jgi:hypothetical protein
MNINQIKSYTLSLIILITLIISTTIFFIVSKTTSPTSNIKKLKNMYPTSTLSLNYSKNINQNTDTDYELENITTEDENTIRLSGTSWCEKYKGSTDIKDLTPEFSEKVSKFIEVLEDAGAKVEVLTTLRTEQSCYLYHYAFKISRGIISPENVPIRSDVKIDWTHNTLRESKEAATAMVLKWDISYQPSLTSNHIGGNAVDLLISWDASKEKPLKIKDSEGNSHIVIFPKTETDPSTETLDLIAESFGIYNLKGDKNHWSNTGD